MEAGERVKARRARTSARSRGESGLLKRLRQAERRLRQVQERYEIAMGAINEGLYDWDIVRDQVYFWGGMERLLGLPSGLLKSSFRDWHDRIHPGDFALYRDATIAHLKGTTQRFECEYRYRALDGTWRWARTHGLAQRDAGGRAVRMVGSTGDITELKERERELAAQKAILETTLENIDQGITMVDKDLRTIALNRRFLELLGFPPERFARGFHMEEAFRFNAERGEYGPGDVEEQVRQRVELARRFEPHAFERTRPDGTAIAVRGKPLASGGFVSTYTDVTEQKRTESALRESEERYALATRAATEGIYEWNVETGALFLSERAREVFGLPAGGLRNTSWNERVHPDDRAGYRAALIEHFKARTAQLECEYRVRDASGSYRWILDRAKAVLDARGRVVKLVGAESDITQRKLAEIELRRTRDRAQEALEQQTATAEILKVTSRSPTDVQPVFEAILTNASRLCAASFAAVFLYDGETLRNVAHRNASAEFARSLQQMRPRPSRETTTRRCALERRTIHTADLLNDPEFSPPEAQRRENVRTALSVPMMREDALVGVITLWRGENRPFTDKQIALVETFADQAVIAIENVRLFNETREALEEQIATAQTLRVVAQLQSDVQPVFDAIARNAAELCGAMFSCVYRFDGELLHLVAIHNLPPAAQELARTMYPMRPDRSQLAGRAVLTRAVQRLEDVAQDGEYAKQVAVAGAWRRFLAVPMLREGKPLGVIGVGWPDPGSIPERQVELLKTFADQAVIAIENVRLFNETREALDRQTATAEVLRVISGSITDTQPVFDAIVRNCQRLFGGRAVALVMPNGAMLQSVAFASDGNVKGEEAPLKPWPLDRDSAGGACILDSRVIAVPDIAEVVHTYPRIEQLALELGYSSALFVPLMREGKAIACLAMLRAATGGFSDKEISLASTFADQAVIAIENARLFNEIQDKSRQLEIASRHKSEFLANMSHELRTPLNAIIGFTRIVLRRSQESLEPKQYENLEKILASGEHLLALINSILDLSKIEAGRIEVHPGEVGLAPVLEHCVRTVEPLARVTLVKEFDGELPRMYVDEEKLRQIMINLLSNAAKFTEQGAIRLKAHAANGSVAITVSDSGIGIPPDKLEVIFEEFEQVDATNTRAHGGTGLGLAIARRLARLMGGDITAESVLGAGSTFRLSLPLRYGAPA
jgi:PAS domain S-box-containing protein